MTFIELPSSVREEFGKTVLKAAQRYHWTKPGEREYWRVQSLSVARDIVDSPEFMTLVLCLRDAAAASGNDAPDGRSEVK